MPFNQGCLIFLCIQVCLYLWQHYSHCSQEYRGAINIRAGQGMNWNSKCIVSYSTMGLTERFWVMWVRYCFIQHLRLCVFLRMRFCSVPDSFYLRIHYCSVSDCVFYALRLSLGVNVNTLNTVWLNNLSDCFVLLNAPFSPVWLICGEKYKNRPPNIIRSQL